MAGEENKEQAAAAIEELEGALKYKIKEEVAKVRE